MYHRFAHLELRFGHGIGSGFRSTDDVGRNIGRAVEGLLARQVDAEQLEAILAITLDEIERARAARQRFESQLERSLSRLGHPEERIGIDAFRAGQGIAFAVGQQVGFGTDPDPIARMEIGIRMEHGSRVAQFDFGNVERHGVGRLNQGILHAFVPLRARGGQPQGCGCRQKGNLVVHNGFDLILLQI